MYLKRRGLVMDGHAWLTYDYSVTIITLRLCSLHAESIFNAEHVFTRMVTLCHELLYILGFDLYTVSMTLVDAA
jgi:hypothetical protein